MLAGALLLPLALIAPGCGTSDGEPDSGADAAGPVFEGLREINGTRLWVAEYGAGEPLVVVHGGPGFDHRYMLPGLVELSDTRRVIFYDQRASGRSALDVTAEQVSLEHFIEDLDALREAYGIERMHLLGHSFGGMLVMRYAIRYPDHVQSLLLVNSTAASNEYQEVVNRLMAERLTPEQQERRAELLQSEALQKADPAAIREFLHILLSANFHDPGAVERLDLYVADDAGARSEALQGLQADLGGFDIHDELTGLAVPTLVVRGDSEVLPVEASERILAAIPGSRAVELERCGHFPFVEQPEVLTAELRAFLDEVEAAGR